MANGEKQGQEADREAERARGAVAVNLKRWRETAKLSQSALAKATGVSVSYVSMIERGERFPQPEILIRLVYAMGRDRWTDAFKSAA
jgi:transcriptional regulator with XRE-family HTH domain